MSDNLAEDEIVYKNRIILRETILKRLTSKYLDLISKFNTLTRNEMAQVIKEILNEIDLMEISILKAENLEKLKAIDKEYQKKINERIVNSIDQVKKEVQEGTVKLQGALQEKEYKIQCEETAKIVNSYQSRDVMNREIEGLENEITKIQSKDSLIMNKLDGQSKKMSLLVKLVNDLKSTFEGEVENINDENYDRMLVD